MSSFSILEMTGLSNKSVPSESMPLSASSIDRQNYTAAVESSKVLDENAEFFPVISDEMEKVNKFFVGKLAELRLKLDDIMRRRRNQYLTHHTSAESDLTALREIYIQLAALRSFCDLNQTGCKLVFFCIVIFRFILYKYLCLGFYKIIKKFDKVMGEQVIIDI